MSQIPNRLWPALAILCALAIPCRGDDLPKQDEKSPKKDAYRFDGKTFDQWRTAMVTELKPERRVEALVAMKAFGTRGYAKEAVAAILLLVEDHFRENDMDSRQKWYEAGKVQSDENAVLAAARAALVAMQPTSQPLLVEWLKNANEKMRRFSLDFFVGNRYWDVPQGYALTADAVPALVDVCQAANVDVAIAGLTALARQLDSDDTEKGRDFRAAFDEQMKDGARAANIIKALERTVERGGSPSITVSRYLGPKAKAVTPALLAVLADKGRTSKTRIEALNALEKIEAEPSRITPHLIEGMKADFDFALSDTVFDYLSRLQGEDAVPDLLLTIKRARRDGSNVAEAARQAISKIQGEKK